MGRQVPVQGDEIGYQRGRLLAGRGEHGGRLRRQQRAAFTCEFSRGWPLGRLLGLAVSYEATVLFAAINEWL
ncbi:hypothetical protein AB0L59_35600 [Streptomyces sp. NPDC052109]|uniref:hypothetical protein n=1 Tax=Streptomyces sp. NPDC052109 TaxID=3155527 RepID=UPI003439976B